MGWLLVAFDLPVKTREEKHRYVKFRDFLLEDGYQMIQFSVYVRPCVTFSRQQTHINRLKASIPEDGHVRAIFLTRAQWEKAFIICGSPSKPQDPESLPEQFLLW